MGTTIGALILGILVGLWFGRRWERVRQEAICREGLCSRLLSARADTLAQGLKLEEAYRTIREARERIHGLKTSRGMLMKECQKLAYQAVNEVR
jgi:hypothetical protein